jgi:adenylosuccinate synthase
MLRLRGANVPGTVIVGTQWGDEGKGRFTDYLAQESDLVVRYRGGLARAIGSSSATRSSLQLVPSGVLYPHVTADHRQQCRRRSRVLIEGSTCSRGKGVDTSREVVRATRIPSCRTTRSSTA